MESLCARFHLDGSERKQRLFGRRLQIPSPGDTPIFVHHQQSGRWLYSGSACVNRGCRACILPVTVTSHTVTIAAELYVLGATCSIGISLTMAVWTCLCGGLPNVSWSLYAPGPVLIIEHMTRCISNQHDHGHGSEPRPGTPCLLLPRLKKFPISRISPSNRRWSRP